MARCNRRFLFICCIHATGATSLRSEAERAGACAAQSVARQADDPRVVFSITTIKARLPSVKRAVDSVVEGQTRQPDVVYLSVGPDIQELPPWLLEYNKTTCQPGLLKVLHMERDYGPSSKLLAALAEGGERSSKTIVIYGDDDIEYGDKVVEMHLAAQRQAKSPTAFGTRRISIGHGRWKESLLEATGTISLPANVVPHEVFSVADKPDACRLSDDYWIAHFLGQAGVNLELLPDCQYDYALGRWPTSCGAFVSLREVASVAALSKAKLDHAGKRFHAVGDWRDQLGRYEKCQSLVYA